MSEMVDRTDPGDYFKDTSVAENYDRYIVENIPYYNSTVSTICDYIKNAYGQAASEKRAIEFGAGTANVSLALIDRVGLAKVLLLDHSAGMLEAALRKVQERGLALGRVKTLQSPMLDRTWKSVDDFKRPDIVLFHLSLDHVEHDTDLITFLSEIYQSMNTGGTLILAEKCANGASKISESWRSFEKMIDFRTQHMLDSGLMSDAQAGAWRRHLLEEDILRPLATLWQFVENAGFRVDDAYGAPLPKVECMSYETYYCTKSLQHLGNVRTALDQKGFGVGVLFCVKDS